ncbi:mediator of RNA polymerase II transcription subunit 12 isoform X2 [Patella vulgata]|uniref:mediator of RNA polymerase II transcription subunit 12 isoform X2 n=1 Tax=Patella vulgata TaxID=6465 RepID=UPI0024A988A3|nr:mediator of RNA polymerase II transcription subunit 12 isoform X2 [Patella vulgata]
MVLIILCLMTMSFRCLITIQGQNLATARTAANSKASAKHLAAAHVLYQLYETKPIIVADTHDPSPRTVTLAELQKKADELRKSGVEVPEIEEREMGTNKTEEEGEESKTENNLKGKVDKYIVHALQRIVEEFFVEDTLKDLFVGPDVSNLYVSACGTFKTKYLHVRRSATPEGGNCFYKSYHPKKILELLRKNNGQMGKYHTLKSSEVPKSSDLALELASSQRTYNAAVQQQQQTEKNKQMALMHIKKGAGNVAYTNKRKFPPQVHNQFENNTFGPNSAKKVKSQGFQSPNQGYQKQNQGYQKQNRGVQDQNQGFQKQNQGFQKQNKGFQQQNQGFQNKGFQKTQGFQQQTQGYKKQAQGFQQRNQGFQKKNQGFQMQNPGLKGQNQGFQGQNQDFQGQNPGFKGQNQGFQGHNQGFQGQNQGFQMQNQGAKKQKRGGLNQFSNQQFQQSYDQGYGDEHFGMDYGDTQEEYYEIPSTMSQMNQSFTNPQHGAVQNKGIGKANRGAKRMLPLRPSEEFERAYEDFSMDQGAGYDFSQGEYQDTNMAMMEGAYFDSNTPAVGWDTDYSDQGFMQDSGYQQFRVPDSEYYNMV